MYAYVPTQPTQRVICFQTKSKSDTFFSSNNKEKNEFELTDFEQMSSFPSINT